MISINFKKYLDFSILFGFILLIFGYYISGSISMILDAPSRIINIAYRGLVTFLFIVPFICIDLKKVEFNRSEILFILFWLCYLFRVLYDININGILPNNSYNKGLTKSFVYLFLFFNILIPLFVIVSGKIDVLVDKIFLYAYYFLGIATLVLFYTIISNNAFIDQVETVRFSLNRGTQSVINPIRISYLGTLGLTTWLFRFLFFKITRIERIVLLILSGLSGFLLIIGASRGPVLIVLFILIIIVFNYLKKQTSFLSKFKVYSGVLLFTSIMIYYVSINIDKIIVVDRIINTAEKLSNGKEDERTIVFNVALQQFLSNPVLGSSYMTISEDNDYDRVFPHNILLESLMSIGIFGTLLLLGVLISYLGNLLKINRYRTSKQYFILITLPFLLNSLISGAILLDNEFWLLLAFSISLKKDN